MRDASRVADTQRGELDVYVPQRHSHQQTPSSLAPTR